MSQPKFLFFVHDCAPIHLERLKKVEKLIEELGIKKVHWLWIPHYHHQVLSSESPAFSHWCKNKTGPGNEWLLHGYFHLEVNHSVWNTSTTTSTGSAQLNPFEYIRQRFLTNNEGEFASLLAEETQFRLENGKLEFEKNFGYTPKLFVPPAWLASPYLKPVLKKQGFTYCESHLKIWNPQNNLEQKAPVITWPTHRLLLRLMANNTNPAYYHLVKKYPVLRIAIHPFDMDFPDTLSSIRKVVSWAKKSHKISSISELNLDL